MVFNEFLKGIAISQIFITTILAFKYDIVMQDELIFTPCDGVGYTYYDEYLDISNLKTETLANGSVYVNGEIKVIRDAGVTENPVSVQTFRKKRDNWVSTIYNLGHEDACTYLFKENEIWSNLLQDIPEEHRKCPFYKGQKINLSVVVDILVHIPDPQFAGEYKVHIIVNLKEPNEVLCVAMHADIYRV